MWVFDPSERRVNTVAHLGLNAVALSSPGLLKLYKLLSTKDRAAESTKGKRDTTEGVEKREEKRDSKNIRGCSTRALAQSPHLATVQGNN
jgi:hypothetical protein